ncbi:MAG: uncharacterized protein A8A55_3130 [Amphiamblys sp. WSBS2006]|nr:MAG: uncharacterized protein A8A55_3130 [Amphiamblys sp. WSBS2006]
MTGGSDRDTISIIEVKREREDDLEEALFQAALYAIKWYTMNKKEGTFILNFAAVSLPEIKSRLGTIKLKLIPGREFEICSMVIYDLVKWGKTGKEAQEFVNHVRKPIIIAEDL